MEEASGNYWYMTSPLYMVADKKLGLDWAVKIFIAHTSTPMPGAVSVSLTEHIMIKGERLKPSDVTSHEGHLTVQQTRWLQTYLSRFNLVWPSSVTGDEGIHSPMSQEKGKEKKVLQGDSLSCFEIVPNMRDNSRVEQNTYLQN